MRISFIRNYHQRVLQVFVAAWFFIGLAIYLKNAIEDGAWIVSGLFRFPLRFDWLLGLSLAAIVIYFLAKLSHSTFSKIFQRKYSLLELFIGIAVLTCATAIITLTAVGVPAAELTNGAFIVLGKIALVFFGYALFTMFNYGIGNELAMRLGIQGDSVLGKFLLSFGIGLGLTVLYFYVVSVMQLLSLGSLIVYVFITLAVGWRQIVQAIDSLSRRRLSPGKINFMKVFISLLALSWFLILFLSLALPHPVGGDDLRAYYNLPKTFIEQGGIASFQYYDANNAPHIGTYLYIPIILVSDFLLNYVNLYFFLIALVVIYCVTSTIKNSSAGWWSVLLFASIPWNYWFITTVKIDFIAVFYMVLTLLALFIYQKHSLYRWLALAGYFFGIAVGVKFSSLIMLPVLFAVLLIWPGPQNILHAVKKILIVGVFVGIALAPWVVRSYAVYGNILHPYSVSGTSTTLSSVSEIDGTPSHRRLKSYFSFIHNSFTHGLSYTNSWFTNVWSIFSARSYYPANATGPFFFLLLPLLAFGMFRRNLRPIIMLSAGTTILWYWVSLFQVWYMMFIFAFLSIVYGASISVLSRKLRMTMLIAIILILTLMMNTSRIQFVQYLLPQFTSDTAVAFQQSVSLINFVNNELLIEFPSYVMYYVSGGIRSAYITDNNKHKFLESDIFNINDIFVYEFEPNELLDRMQSSGITHIYYSPSADAYWRNYYCPYSDDGKCFQSRVKENVKNISPYLIEVYTESEGAVYELNYEAL